MGRASEEELLGEVVGDGEVIEGFHIVMGWVWPSMAIVGLTGVAKK